MMQARYVSGVGLQMLLDADARHWQGAARDDAGLRAEFGRRFDRHPPRANSRPACLLWTRSNSL